MFLLWTLIGFIFGAIPFSLLIGRWKAGQDIRRHGDQNPGATNVLRAGSFSGFLLALILDITKGALPVGIAYHLVGIQDWRIVPIALAPPLGHAFSPFLNWQGGKAIAATFGTWIGLTIWTMPLLSLSSLSLLAWLIAPHGWAVMMTLALMGLGIIFGCSSPSSWRSSWLIPACWPGSIVKIWRRSPTSVYDVSAKQPNERVLMGNGRLCHCRLPYLLADGRR